MIPTIKVKCEKGHEWDIAIAPWWFSIQDIKCPECDQPAQSAIWNGMQEIGQGQ